MEEKEFVSRCISSGIRIGRPSFKSRRELLCQDTGSCQYDSSVSVFADEDSLVNGDMRNGLPVDGSPHIDKSVGITLNLSLKLLTNPSQPRNGNSSPIEVKYTGKTVHGLNNLLINSNLFFDLRLLLEKLGIGIVLEVIVRSDGGNLLDFALHGLGKMLAKLEVSEIVLKKLEASKIILGEALKDGAVCYENRVNEAGIRGGRVLVNNKALAHLMPIIINRPFVVPCSESYAVFNGQVIADPSYLEELSSDFNIHIFRMDEKAVSYQAEGKIEAGILEHVLGCLLQ